MIGRQLNLEIQVVTEVLFKLYQDQDILILTQGYPEAVRGYLYLYVKN